MQKVDQSKYLQIIKIKIKIYSYFSAEWALINLPCLQFYCQFLYSLVSFIYIFCTAKNLLISLTLSTSAIFLIFMVLKIHWHMYALSHWSTLILCTHKYLYISGLLSRSIGSTMFLYQSFTNKWYFIGSCITLFLCLYALA